MKTRLNSRIGRFLSFLLSLTLVLGPTSAFSAPGEETILVSGNVEMLYDQSLQLQVDGSLYQLSGLAPVHWQNGRPAAWTSLAAGMHVRMEVVPAVAPNASLVRDLTIYTQ